jgi:hypothetical protein
VTARLLLAIFARMMSTLHPMGGSRAFVFLAAPLGDFCSDGVFVKDFAPYGWCHALDLLFPPAPLGDFCSDGVFVEDCAPCGWCHTLVVLFPLHPYATFARICHTQRLPRLAVAVTVMHRMSKTGVAVSFDIHGRGAGLWTCFSWGIFVAIYYMALPR